MDFAEFQKEFCTVMEYNGLAEFATEDLSRKFYSLTERMLEVNKSMNLTAIKEQRAIILRHYADSLSVAKFLPQNAKIADVGCGAGFPSLPLAICRPDLSILSLDSTEKRIRYVEQTAALLGLDNLRAVAMRAEDGARGEFREAFDVCTARAVAALPVLSELCLPYVRVGGLFLAMKAARAPEELEQARSAITALGGIDTKVHPIVLKNDEETDERVIIQIKKGKATPQNLPRPYAKIVKRPL